jgi:thioredoxin 1
MSLETLQPNPAWVADAYVDTVETLDIYSDQVVYRIFGGDWCKDCRAQLPDFGAALEAADVPEERIHEYALDENKEGPGVEEYGIEKIPTVIVEDDDGEEIARFVEDESLPIALYLAEKLRDEFDS